MGKDPIVEQPVTVVTDEQLLSAWFAIVETPAWATVTRHLEARVRSILNVLVSHKELTDRQQDRLLGSIEELQSFIGVKDACERRQQEIRDAKEKAKADA